MSLLKIGTKLGAEAPVSQLTRTRIDLLVDVRSPEDYATGHLHGARNIPVQELASRLEEGGPRQTRVAV